MKFYSIVAFALAISTISACNASLFEGTGSGKHKNKGSSQDSRDEQLMRASYIRTMPIANILDVSIAFATNESYTIDGFVFENPKKALENMRTALVQLSEKWGTIGELEQASDSLETLPPPAHFTLEELDSIHSFHVQALNNDLIPYRKSPFESFGSVNEYDSDVSVDDAFGLYDVTKDPEDSFNCNLAKAEMTMVDNVPAAKYDCNEFLNSAAGAALACGAAKDVFPIPVVGSVACLAAGTTVAKFSEDTTAERCAERELLKGYKTEVSQEYNDRCITNLKVEDAKKRPPNNELINKQADCLDANKLSNASKEALAKRKACLEMKP